MEMWAIVRILIDGCRAGGRGLIVFIAAACITKPDRSQPPDRTAFDSTNEADSGSPAKRASQEFVGSGYACAENGFATRMWARDSSAGAGGVRNPETYTLQLHYYTILPGPDPRTQLVRRKDVLSQTVTLLPDGTYRSTARFPKTRGDLSKSKVLKTTGRYLKSPARPGRASIAFTGPGGACDEVDLIEYGTAFKSVGGVPPPRGGTDASIVHIYRRSTP